MVWTAVLAVVVLGGLFVLRGVAATVLFYFLLPDDDRCPCCDSRTLWIESRGMLRWMPWFRTSWCFECGWKGLLRHPERTPAGRSVAQERHAKVSATPRH